MPTPQEAQAELAKRELARRGVYTEPKKQGMMGKAWDALKVPEQKSREGLNMLAGMVHQGKVTGNLPMDMIRGTPKIAAETLAETAPGFVSRGSMLAAGAAPVISKAMKAAAPLGKAVAGGLEDWAGIKPAGSLAETFKRPFSQFMTRGKEAAKPLYEAADKEMEAGASLFKGMYKPEQIVDKAREVLDKGGKLEPTEALTYRKAVDSLMKSGRYVKDELLTMRDEANQIVKGSENLSKADVLHKKGLMASAMRALGPKNVGGKVSPFKIAEGLAMAHMGPVGKLAGAALSPLALGTGASALGAAGQVASSPQAAVTALQLMRKKKKNEDPNSLQ